MHGVGEKFSPDLFTGTGNITIPLPVPAGRNGLQPNLDLTYSSGSGNGPCGVGWSMGPNCISRKMSGGVPIYDDTQDVFLLSGSEDLVPVPGGTGTVQRYRPRSESLFSRIEHHRDAATDHWEVRNKDGQLSIFGTPGQLGTDPAVIADPANRAHVFEWELTRTLDPFGNCVEYFYVRDAIRQNGPHLWDQLYLSEIRYADFGDPAAPQFLITVHWTYASRPDPFSWYTAGFEIRTVQRCTQIDFYTHPGQTIHTATVYLRYADQMSPPPVDLPPNGFSLLQQIQVEGHDGNNSDALPPIEFTYSAFDPEGRKFFSLTGPSLPPDDLSSPAYALVDLFGRGLPDILQMDGLVVRYWRNLGGGRFDWPRTMDNAPAGFSIADPSVQLIDANGDGCMDLLVTRPMLSGYFPMRFGGLWDRKSFVPYTQAPSFDLKDPEVHLVDLNGDGVTDAIRSATCLECYFNDADEGWISTRFVQRGSLSDFPNVDFMDPRVHWADMTGGGLQDIVLIHQELVQYWPHMGYGNWGQRVDMVNNPHLPFNYDPTRILLGDVDGDGVADLIYVEDNQVTLWINQSGNSWAAPVIIRGTPPVNNAASLRLTDLLGTGVSGILWSSNVHGENRASMYFLDLTGGVKPYLLNRMDNHLGAETQVTYASSTQFYLQDQQSLATQWNTTLPFPVQVVASMRSVDAISGGQLTNEYSYHHGYWDGTDREFRGFGRVDQRSTEVFAVFNSGAPVPVPLDQFSPPTETRTWFHQGPLGDEFGGWTEPDYSREFWAGDPSVLTRPPSMINFLNSLERRVRRDAIRALRGQSLRSEVYGLDGTALTGLPYTVIESLFGLREEQPPTPSEPPDRLHIFFSYKLAERTTQWERGADPMTRFAFMGEPDPYGQALLHVDVAVPRGRAYQAAALPGQPYLATCARMDWAERDDAQLYMINRPARSTHFQVQNDGSMSVFDLQERVLSGTAVMQVINQVVNFYDGEAFQGLAFGQLGNYGALTRTEELVFTTDILNNAYRSGAGITTPPEQPPYLATSGMPPWTPDYPDAFRVLAPSLGGYIFHPADTTFAGGFYAATAQRRYDFQSGPSGRGSVLVKRDSLGADTTISYDGYALCPVQVTNAAGLTTVAVYDYRVLKVQLFTDPNGNRTAYNYTPLGQLSAQAVMGKITETVGDTLAVPGATWQYDFWAFWKLGQPISVTSIQRVHHVNDTGVPPAQLNDTIQSVAYSDGFGRSIQTRGQAEAWVFGNTLSGDAGLPIDQTQPIADAVGVQAPPGTSVIVSQWQVYDNKGQVVEKYDPFFSSGWAYSAPTPSQLSPPSQFFYDPRGQVLQTIRPDGSESLVVYGIPPDLTQPKVFTPTPWESYFYDPNDNAGRTDPMGSVSYQNHWNTPRSQEIDALGRIIRTVQRPSQNPTDWLTTTFIFDIQGNLLSVIDPLDRTASTQVYDLKQQTLRSQQIDGGVKRSIYDSSGNLIEHRDAKGALILYGYDNLQRKLRFWARNEGASPVTLRHRLVYGDAAESGLTAAQAAAVNVLGAVWRQYDEAGLASVTQNDFKGNPLEQYRQVIADSVIAQVFVNAASTGWTIPAWSVDWLPAPGETWDSHASTLLNGVAYSTSTTYDALNRITNGLYPTGVDGLRHQIQLGYDPSGGLQSVSVDGTAMISWIARNAQRQRILTVYGNGTMNRRAYDPLTHGLRRLRSEAFSQPQPSHYHGTGPALQDSAYAVDKVGNVLWQYDRFPSCGIPGTPSGLDALDRQFSYDATYRLLSATGRAIAAPALAPWDGSPLPQDPTLAAAYEEDYVYDAADNLQQLRRQTGGSATVKVFTLAAGTNQLLSTSVGSTTAAYVSDASGNIVSEDTSRHLEWDHSDRLRDFHVQTTAAEPSLYAIYLYDPTGARVKKWVRKQGGSVETTVYIGGVYEMRSWGAAAGQQNNRLYVNENHTRLAVLRIGPAEPGDTAPSTQYWLSDYLGSAALVIDATGSWINREEYFPYGPTSFGGFAKKRYRFAGKERDEESGLDYVGARYYAPWLMRWTSTDPAGMKAGFNLYTYAKNNPVTCADPSGLEDSPPKDAEEADARDAGAGAPVANPAAEKEKDAGASHSGDMEKSGLHLEKAADVKETHANLRPGGAAPPEVASKGFVSAETNKHQNEWAKNESVTGMKAGAVNFGIDIVQLVLSPLYLSSTYRPLLQGMDTLRIETNTPLASNVSSGTYFALTAVSMGVGEVAAGMSELRAAEGALSAMELKPPSMIASTTSSTAAAAAEGGEKYVTVFRFYAADNPKSLLPNAAQLGPDAYAKAMAQVEMSPGMKQAMAELHMRGITAESPFVSVLDNPTSGAMSSDPWLKRLATGCDWHPPTQNFVSSPAPYATDLGIFRVPESRLVYPANPLSNVETERVFLGDDLEDFLVHTWRNPY